jgi:L-amino acid N-acyltransferase YncA
MHSYPKQFKLKDNTVITLGPMVKEDEPRLLEFFRRLPDEDRLFLKEDVTRPEIIHRWIEELNYDRVLPILAESGGTIIGDATLHAHSSGWMRHVGEIRCVVAREYQRKGIGVLLVRELLDEATHRGLRKIQTQFLDNQIGAMQAFERVGFLREAVLKKMAEDLNGKEHDIIIMTNNVSELWQKMEDLILDKEFFVEM